MAIKRCMISGIFIVFLLSLGACKSTPEKKTLITQMKRLSSYRYDLSTAPHERIYHVPPFLLNYWKEFDSRYDYFSYMPDDNERDTIKKSFENLPPLHRKALSNVIGIYFIENFMGGGLADWVVDEKTNFYCTLIFNPASLKQDLSRWITIKEQSGYAYSTNGSGVEVDVNADLSGFFYILCHEMTHVTDYFYRLTPYPEESVAQLRGITNRSDFTDPYWKDYKTPVSPYDIKNRRKVRIYGFAGQPGFPVSEAKVLYENLLKTPFVSIYGSQNWAEDLAEYVTFYHIVRKFDASYKIRFYCAQANGTFLFEPMKNPLVKARSGWVENTFY